MPYRPATLPYLSSSPSSCSLAGLAMISSATGIEDVMLGRGFDSLELSIGEAEVLGRHDIVLRH